MAICLVVVWEDHERLPIKGQLPDMVPCFYRHAPFQTLDLPILPFCNYVFCPGSISQYSYSLMSCDHSHVDSEHSLLFLPVNADLLYTNGVSRGL